MPTELAVVPSSTHRLSTDLTRHSSQELVYTGAELVGLSERFYRAVFVGGLLFVGVASLAALLMLPTRRPMASETAAIPAIAITVMLALGTPLALWRATALYRLLRIQPRAQLGLVFVSGVLMAFPVHDDLWWPSCALMMLLAPLVSVPRVLTYCAAVLLIGNLGTHAVMGDLRNMPVLSLTGIWGFYPLWVLALALIPDRLAGHLMRLNAIGDPHPLAPLRVANQTPCPPSQSPGVASDQAPPTDTQQPRTVTTPYQLVSGEPARPVPDIAGPLTRLERLTARQLQVVALVADGLRYQEVADCLSISMRQVQRHVAQAAARLGVTGAYELVAIAVAQGLVHSGDAGPEAGKPAP